MVIFANCFPETYIYNWGDLFLPKEENSDSTNNRTVSLINGTVPPLNATTLAPPNATTLDPINTTTANAVSNSESLVENILHSLFDGYKLSSCALAQNLLLLNGLYVGILCTMALHAVLFYFQVWKPFKEEEDEDEPKENETKGDEKKAEMKNKEDGEDLDDDASPSSFSPTLRKERRSRDEEGEESIKMLQRD